MVDLFEGGFDFRRKGVEHIPRIEGFDPGFWEVLEVRGSGEVGALDLEPAVFRKGACGAEDAEGFPIGTAQAGGFPHFQDAERRAVGHLEEGYFVGKRIVGEKGIAIAVGETVSCDLKGAGFHDADGTGDGMRGIV